MTNIHLDDEQKLRSNLWAMPKNMPQISKYLNVKELVEVARARWKIENETFNTLKNQGYHLEHNYGHGKKYLATNLAILTFLAFLVDQIAQHLDKDFKAAKKACKTFKNLWQTIKSVFYLISTMSMNAIYRFIIKRRQVDMPALE